MALGWQQTITLTTQICDQLTQFPSLFHRHSNGGLRLRWRHHNPGTASLSSGVEEPEASISSSGCHGDGSSQISLLVEAAKRVLHADFHHIDSDNELRCEDLLAKVDLDDVTHSVFGMRQDILSSRCRASFGDVKCGDLLLRINRQGNITIQKRGFRTQIGSIGITPRTKESEKNKSITPQMKQTGKKLIKGVGKIFSSMPTMDSQVQKNTHVLKPITEEEKIKLLALAEVVMAGQEKKSWWRDGIWTFLKYMLIPFLCLVTISFLNNRGPGFGFWFSDDNEVSPEEIMVSFGDVKGIEEAKAEVMEIVDYLRDPQKFNRLGGRLPKGVLLVGPPGTGKTLLARAIAGEAQVPFFHASGSEFDELFVGQGAKRVRDLFAKAKQKAPCVIFIDEMDSVGQKRSSSLIHPYANQTINQLLAEMDGFKQNTGVIVLGATNRQEELDRALMRPGRFDVLVHVNIPDFKGRKDILQLYLAKVSVSRDVKLDVLAHGTVGFSGADLENLINQAALKSAADGRPDVNMEYLESAKDKIIMGPEKKNRIADEDVNRSTAYHEAGHTLVAYYTKYANPIHKVTIIPRGESLGHTALLPEKEVYSQSKAQLLAMMDVMMGGRAAEEVINGSDNVSMGASNDLDKATLIATSMVKMGGMSEKVGLRTFPKASGELIHVNELSPSTQDAIDMEIKRLLAESYDRAKSILKTRSAEHKRLADTLLEYETLDANEVKAIIEGKSSLLNRLNNAVS